jgi:hypothetical protein
MTRFARTVHIEAPAADIWAVLMDVEAWPGRLLSLILRRTLFSRNTKSATEGLKRHVEKRRPS